MINKLIPASLKIPIVKALRAIGIKKVPVHLENVFGFDIYQNSLDCINYKKYVGCSLDSLPDSLDANIFSTMNKYIVRDSVAIDVGANIGLMTLVMSKLTGDKGQVLSFEPGPISFGLLRRNVYSNFLHSNVSISDKAVSDSVGIFNLFVNPRGESDNQLHKTLDSYHFRDEGSRRIFPVNTITLDKHLADCSIDYADVSFVKIDVQGHDPAVLRGGQKLFESATKIAVLVELAPYLKAWEIQTIEEFYCDIISMGFDVYDNSNLQAGIVDLEYLIKNYGFTKVGLHTDLLLLKGLSIQVG